MITRKLEAQPREDLGKAAVKKLRTQDRIPCILNTKSGPINFHAERNALHKLIYTPETYLIELSIGDKSYNAVLQESQFDPIHDNLLHSDFIEAPAGQEVKVQLPVRLKGQSAGILEGGRLVQKMRKMRVKGLVENLPDQIEIDITDLKLGKSLKIRDLEFEGFEVLANGSVPVASVEIPRALRVQQGPTGPK